jgi:hypothetical protein
MPTIIRSCVSLSPSFSFSFLLGPTPHKQEFIFLLLLLFLKSHIVLPPEERKGCTFCENARIVVKEIYATIFCFDSANLAE